MKVFSGFRTAVLAAAVGGICLPARATKTRTFQNPTAITIPDFYNFTSPYPSTIKIKLPKGKVVSVTVRLLGLTAPYASELSALVGSPSGKAVLLMSDMGGINSLPNVNLTFQDGAPMLPLSTQILSGTYSPSNDSVAADYFLPPAPAAPWSSVLSVFNGDPDSGVWSLYMADDSTFLMGPGLLANGWSITFKIDEEPKLRIKGVKRTTTTRARYKLTGTAKDDSRKKSILVKVNKGRFKKARGFKRWRAIARLKPGRNVITVVAEDSEGNESKPRKQRVFYLPS